MLVFVMLLFVIKQRFIFFFTVAFRMDVDTFIDRHIKKNLVYCQ